MSSDKQKLYNSAVGTMHIIQPDFTRYTHITPPSTPAQNP